MLNLWAIDKNTKNKKIFNSVDNNLNEIVEKNTKNLKKDITFH